MSFYKPSIVAPDNISYDATSTYTFKWQTNGTEPQVAYRLYIYNNLTNALVYDSNKITSAILSHVVPVTLSNGNIYKWKVWVYKNTTNYLSSDFVLFKTNSAPTLTINTFPSVVTTQNYTFSATYTQAQSVPIKTYKFILYDTTDKIVYDSADIYSQTISHEIKGMANTSSFKIQCQVVDQNGIITKSAIVSFTTNYSVPVDIPSLTILPLNDLGLIKLEWDNIQQVLGTVNGTYSYVSGKFNLAIHLNPNSILEYGETIVESFTDTFWVKLSSGFIGNIISLNDKVFIGYDGSRFTLKNDYRLTAGLPRSLPSGFFLIGLKANKAIIVTSSYTDIIV